MTPVKSGFQGHISPEQACIPTLAVCLHLDGGKLRIITSLSCSNLSVVESFGPAGESTSVRVDFVRVTVQWSSVYLSVHHRAHWSSLERMQCHITLRGGR